MVYEPNAQELSNLAYNAAMDILSCKIPIKKCERCILTEQLFLNLIDVLEYIEKFSHREVRK